MSNKVSVMGKPINMDALRLQNEETIAVGNMHVNSRGDQLGDGGKIVKTRNEVMQEYYEQKKQANDIEEDEEF